MVPSDTLFLTDPQFKQCKALVQGCLQTADHSVLRRAVQAFLTQSNTGGIS